MDVVATDEVRHRVAVHEAGHVFVAAALGLPVRSVQLGDNPRFDFAAAPETVRRLDHARVLMAGCEAEAAVTRREPIGGGSDDTKVAALLDKNDDELTLRAQVRHLLTLNAGTVKYLAARLAQRGALTGAEVARIVRCSK